MKSPDTERILTKSDERRQESEVVNTREDRTPGTGQKINELTGTYQNYGKNRETYLERDKVQVLAGASEIFQKDQDGGTEDRSSGGGEQIIAEARQRVDGLYQQLRLEAERQARQLESETPQQSKCITAEDTKSNDSPCGQPDDATAIEAEVEMREQTAAAEESETAGDFARKPDSIVKKMLTRWEWIVVILALVTAAVMFSLGLFLI